MREDSFDRVQRHKEAWECLLQQDAAPDQRLESPLQAKDTEANGGGGGAEGGGAVDCAEALGGDVPCAGGVGAGTRAYGLYCDAGGSGAAGRAVAQRHPWCYMGGALWCCRTRCGASRYTGWWRRGRGILPCTSGCGRLRSGRRWMRSITGLLLSWSCLEISGSTRG